MAPKNLLHKLQRDHPQLRFIASDVFRWSPSEQSIYYSPSGEHVDLLHELGHALLGHEGFAQDIELIQKEREAWEYALHNLAPKYRITISQTHIEAAMESYRIWLHSRSLCPECHETGLQTTNGTYYCAICCCQWRANDARRCMLRRFKL